MFTRALLALCCCTAALSGQLPVVNTEILAVALDQPVDGLLIDTGKGIEPFTANLIGLGLPVLYQGARRVVLHKTIEAFHPPAGQPAPQPAGVVELPALANRGLAAKRCYASVWSHRPRRRNYVFVFDGSHPSKPITSRRFHDIPPAITAAR